MNDSLTIINRIGFTERFIASKNYLVIYNYNGIIMFGKTVELNTWAKLKCLKV